MELKTKIYSIALISFYLLGIAITTAVLKEIPYFTAVAFAFLVAANVLVYVPLIKRRFSKIAVWSVLMAMWFALWAYVIVNKLP